MMNIFNSLRQKFGANSGHSTVSALPLARFGAFCLPLLFFILGFQRAQAQEILVYPESDTFYVNAVADATGYTWTLDGGNIGLTVLAGDTAVVVNSGDLTFGPHLLCVSSFNSCGASAPLCIAFNVLAMPNAVDDINGTLPGIPVGGNLITNDDGNGVPFTIDVNEVTSPLHGTLDIFPDGSYVYTPLNNTFTGEDSADYVICNGFGLCDTATLYITIVPPSVVAVNTPPVANEDAAQTLVDVPVNGNILNNDYDPDGDNIVITIAQLDAPNNGSVVVGLIDGIFTYTPNSGFLGTDEFTYVICDDGSPVLCDTAVVVIDVIPDINGIDNDPPFANDDANGTPINVAVSGNVAPNDFDPNGDALVFAQVTNVTNGTLVFGPNGDYTYTPNPGYVGPDQFTYSACDPFGLCDIATVYLVVWPLGPTAINDINNTLVNVAVGGNILTNDSGNGLPYSLDTNPLAGPANGIIVIDPSGAYTYTPNPGFVGEDMVTYVICNAFGLCDTATLYITVIAPPAVGQNHPPVANEDVAQTFENTPVAGTVLNNDFDPDGDNITVNTTPVSNPSNGSVVLAADGTFTYTPNPGFNGTDVFSYVICDDGNPVLCDTALVVIDVYPAPAPGNNPPFAQDDANWTAINTPVSGTVAPNDSDPNGDVLVFTINTNPANGGTVVLDPNGGYTYTPAPGYVGPDQFTYNACDPFGACDVATVYITVLPIGPDAVNDINNTLVDVAVGGNILTNDSGNGLPFTLDTNPVSGPSNGTIVIQPNGGYVYTPNAGYVGDDQVTYVICNALGLCDTATLYITIVEPYAPNENHAPVANADVAQTYENVPVDGTVLNNDFDPDGDNITLNVVLPSLPAHGTVVIQPNGDFTYTPAPGYTGLDVFTYIICDDGTPSLCDTGTVTIEVYPANGPGNDPPFAQDDANYTSVNTPVSGTVEPNDSDPNGDALVFTINTNPVNGGTVVLDPNGGYTYTPAPGYVGPDQFTYNACDPFGACDVATVYITVLPIGPDAVNDINNTIANVPVSGNILTNDEGNGIPYVLNTTPIDGPVAGSTIVINPDGSYTYTPVPGIGYEDTITYVICNAYGICDTADLYITVIVPPTQGNDPPVANEDVAQTFENTPVSGNLVSNDFDPNGDLVTVNTTPVSNPSNGTVTINPDGTFTYTPNNGFSGVDVFTYVICDPFGLCDTAAVTIEVYPANGPGNDPPFAQDDAVYTSTNETVPGSVAPNDSDPNGDALTFAQGSNPSNGTVVFNPDGSFVYTPNTDYSGPDQFTYIACDPFGLCDTATVYITVLPIGPDAVNDFNNTLVDVPVSGNILTNDADNGLPFVLNTTPISGPDAGATIVINPDGSYVYTPIPGAAYNDTITYVICNDYGLCDTANLYIEVIAPPAGPGNNPPIANNDVAQTFENTPVSGTVINNDFDPNGDPIVVTTTPIDAPGNGTVVLNPDGSFTYTPNAGYVGLDTFTYQVCDNLGLCDEAIVVIEIYPANGPGNDPPFAQDDADYTTINVPIAGNVSPNDSDPNGDVLVYNPNTPVAPSHGTVTIDPAGGYVYTPAPGYVGPDQFTYTVCDPFGLCDTATVYITVFPVGPDAVNDINNTLVDVPVTGNILTNNEGNGLPFVLDTTPINTPNNGTIVILNNGDYTYTPAPGWSGVDTITYVICNAFNLCDTANLYITVMAPANPGGPGPHNDPPVANNDVAQTLENTPVGGTVLNNDFDPNGDPIVVNTTPIDDPNNGTVVINPNGTFVYTPNPSFTGVDTFTYSICDNIGLCDTAIVVIEVYHDVTPPGGPVDPNDPPYAQDDAYYTPVNVTVGGNVSPNDSDPNGDPLTYGTTTPLSPANGTVTIDSAGNFEYIPAPEYVGPDQFTYTVCDPFGLCDTATVYITVFPLGPDAVNDINNTLVDVPVSGNILTNDNGNGLGFVLNTNPINTPDGTIVINPDGSYTYTPVPGAGPYVDTITYVICNDFGLCDTANLYITVIVPSNPGGPGNQNNPPVANNDVAQTLENVPVAGNVLNNDFDPNGDPIVVNTTPVDNPNYGTVVINPNGGFVYTPDPNFNGTDTFTYSICDNNGACDTAIVVIEVYPDLTIDVNDPPFAQDDAAYTPVNLPVGGNVSPNDSDPNGDVLTYGTTTPISPANGTVTIDSAGNYVYTPNAGYVGPDQFTYTVCDGAGLCDTATVYITVFPLGPNAVNDINNTLVDVPVSGNILTNDNGNGLPFVLNTTPINTPGGTIVINPDGSYTYTPVPGAGPYVDTITYVICNAYGLCDTASLYITVINPNTPGGGGPQNTPPVANDDVAQTLENIPVAGNVLNNDFDPNGDPIVVNTTPVDNPNYGTVVINPNGGFVYTPDPNFNGTDTFTYSICDNLGACDTAIVVIEVYPDLTPGANDPPFAQDDANVTPSNVPVGGNLSPNDSDPNGDILTYSPNTPNAPDHGTVTIDSAGNYVYTPTPGYVGPDQFTYVVCDPAGLCDTATVYITVLPQGPNANDDINVTLVNVPVDGNILTNDEGNGLPFVLDTTPVDAPNNGTIVINADGSYTYTPNTGFVGEDTVVYVICNGFGQCDTATLYITVISPTNAPANDPPVGNEDVAETLENTPVSGNVLNNDYDPNGDDITVAVLDSTNYGTLVLNPDGGFTYTPNPNFNGTDTFTYVVCDNGNPSLCDTVDVVINVYPDVNPGNDPPFAQDDANGTPVNTPVSGNVSPNDSDPNGDPLVYNTNTPNAPDHGTVTIDSAGNYVYTPAPGYFGPDQFTYVVCDGSLCDTATVYIMVVPQGPDANFDINYTLVNVPVGGNVLTNDEDPQGFPLTVTGLGNDLPMAGASVTIDSAGNYVYTPAPGYIGTDTFTYIVCNSLGLCVEEVVYIYIIEDVLGNNPPNAADDQSNTYVNTPVGGNVLVNDVDPDGDEVIVTVVDSTNNGTIVIDPNTGGYVYTPNPGYIGVDTFTYVICDPNGLCDTATVIIEVTVDPNGPSNDPPFAQDDAGSSPLNTPITGTLNPNDSDPNGDPLVYSPNTPNGPDHGTVTIDSAGNFVYVPTPGYYGPDQFTYVVCDSAGLCDTATVYITVLPVAPIAVNDINNTLVNIPVPGNVLTNDSDPQGLPLEVTLINGPSNGTVVLDSLTGGYVYTPNAGFVGQDTFWYVACNPIVLCDTAMVIINVIGLPTPQNDPPYAHDDNTGTVINTPVSGNVLNNDVDPDGDPLTVTLVDSTNHGTLVLNPDGSFTYTPDSSFVGVDTFTYVACDPNGLCDTATVIINIIYDPNGPSNDPPVAVDDANITNLNTPVNGTVASNDFDPNGDAIVFGLVTFTTNGTVVLNPDGSYTYTPNAGYFGPDQFIYLVCDQTGCDTATCYIVVLPTGPDAQNDINVTLVDAPVDGNVLINDEDPQGLPVIVTVIDSTNHGTLVYDPNTGGYTYTPDAGYVGQDTFTYVICNPLGLCDTATVIITIVNPTPTGNNPPVANDDNGQTISGVPVTGNVLTNDFDPDNDTLTITIIDSTNHGTIVIDPNGGYTFTPDSGFVGIDTFTYVICDGLGACDTANVIITVYPGNNNTNDPPFAQDDANYTNENVPVAGNVAPNDFDPNGDPLTFGLVTTPAHGTVTIDSAGNYVYTPAPGYSGPDNFTYVTCDNGNPALCDTATVYIIVIPFSPVTNFDQDTIVYSEPIDTVICVEYDNELLGPIVNVEVGNCFGSIDNSIIVSVDTATLCFTFSGTAVGVDSFCFVLTDSFGLTDTIHYVLTVIPDPDTIVIGNILANVDTVLCIYDEPFASLFGTEEPAFVNGTVTIDTVLFLNSPSYGIIVGNNGISCITYEGGAVPGNDTIMVVTFNGTYYDTTYIYIGNAGALVPNFDQDTIVYSEPVNNTLCIEYDGEIPAGAIATVEVANCYGANDNSVIVSIDSSTLCVTFSGTAVGVDSFCFIITDTVGMVDTIHYVLTVIPDPDTIIIAGIAPGADTTICIYDEPFASLFNTEEPAFDNGNITITAIDENGVNYGLVINDNGVSCITFQGGLLPGNDSIMVVTYNGTYYDTTYIYITNLGIEPPVAVNDTVTTDEDVTVFIDVLANDDAGGQFGVFNGDPTVVTPPSNGAVIYTNGSFAYTPNNNFCGPDSFQYAITNQAGLSDSAWVFITIECDSLIIFNGISPNGDGSNDVFWIETIDEYPNNVVEVYNRWGNKVYEGRNYNNGLGQTPVAFDGTFNGDQLPDGTYFYVIDLGDGSAPIGGYLVIHR